MSDPYDFEGRVVCDGETKKAIHVRMDVEHKIMDDRTKRWSVTKQTWIPKLCIHEDSEVYEPGNEGTLIVEEWWGDTYVRF